VGKREDEPIGRGDRAFVLRLLAASILVAVLSFVALGVLDSARLGDCAARGFLQVTEPPSSD
jgi:hypothetical protein